MNMYAVDQFCEFGRYAIKWICLTWFFVKLTDYLLSWIGDAIQQSIVKYFKSRNYSPLK